MTLGSRALLIVLLFVITAGIDVTGHHAVSDVYDQSEILTLEGEIVALIYRNPHSLLHVQVDDRGGALHTWAVEWRAASRLSAQGAGPGTLRPGDRVVVCGNPGWDPGQYRLLLLTVTRPVDGWTADARGCG